MEKPIAYDGDKPFVFISYSHRDIDRVWPIINQMNKNGYRVWYDDGIDPGTEWDEFIATKISECDYFIGFMSANYLASDNCKDELNYARDQVDNRLLVYLEEVQLPKGMEMRLGRIQAIHKYNFKTDNEFFSKLYLSKNLYSFRDEVVVKRINPEERKPFVAGTGVELNAPYIEEKKETKVPEVKEEKPVAAVSNVEEPERISEPETKDVSINKSWDDFKKFDEPKSVEFKFPDAVVAAPKATKSSKKKSLVEPVAMPIVINDEHQQPQEKKTKPSPKISIKKPEFNIKKAEVKPDKKPEIKAEIESEIKAEAEVEIKAEIEPEIKEKTEVIADYKIDNNTDADIDIKTDIEKSEPDNEKNEEVIVDDTKDKNSDIPKSGWDRWGLPGLNSYSPKWFTATAIGIYVVLMLILINRIAALVDHLGYSEFEDIPGVIIMMVASIIVALLALDYGWYMEKMFSVTPSKKKVGMIIFAAILIILMIICFAV